MRERRRGRRREQQHHERREQDRPDQRRKQRGTEIQPGTHPATVGAPIRPLAAAAGPVRQDRDGERTHASGRRRPRTASSPTTRARSGGGRGSPPPACRGPRGPATPRTATSTPPTPAARPRSTPGTGPPTRTARSPTGPRHAPRHPAPDGESIWWFADTDGDEFGHWVTEPFAGGDARAALPGVEDGYPAGLEIGRRLVAAGTSTDDGTRIWLRDRRPTRPRGSCTRTPRTPASVRSPTTRRCWRSPTPSTATRATRPSGSSAPRTGAPSPRSPTAPARGLTPLAFAPVPGDQRLLLLHERRGREELLVWDVAADTETETRDRPARRARGRLRPRRDGAAGLAHARGAHPAVPLRPRDRRR